MFTTDETLDARKVGEGLKAVNATTLMMPRTVLALKEIPVLGSGKTDYVTLNKLAREQVKP